MTEMPQAAAADPGARPRLLIDSQRLDEARTLLQRELAHAPDSADLWCLLALCEFKAKRPDEALRATERARAADPHEEWAYRLASLALTERRRHQEAIAAAREAVRLGPQVWQTHSRLALALSDLTSRAALNEAREAALHSVSLAPQEASTHFTLGVVEQERSAPAAAERAYRQALELDPGFSAALNNLGLLQLRRGRIHDAAEKFTSTIRADPGFDIARQNVAAVGWRLLTIAYYVALVGSVILQRLVDDEGVHDEGTVAPYGVRAVVGGVLLLGWVGLAVWMLRPLPAAARHYLIRLPRRSAGFAVMSLGITACVTATLLAAFSPPVSLARACALIALCAALISVLTSWVVRIRRRFN